MKCCQIRRAEPKALALGDGEARLGLCKKQHEPEMHDRSEFREGTQTNPFSWLFCFDSFVLSSTDREGRRDSHLGCRESSDEKCSSLCSSILSVQQLCQQSLTSNTKDSYLLSAAPSIIRQQECKSFL